MLDHVSVRTARSQLCVWVVDGALREDVANLQAHKSRQSNRGKCLFMCFCGFFSRIVSEVSRDHLKRKNDQDSFESILMVGVVVRE